MSGKTIIESGMDFSGHPPEDFWYIEKSNCYRKKGVQIAEFILIIHQQNREPFVCAVEAKTGSPRPENKTDFDEFIGKVCAKLTNAMMLVVAACLGRHPNCASELPSSFKALDLAKADFRLILVLKGDPNPWPEAWLPDIKDALASKFKPLVNTWQLSPMAVQVLNEPLAKAHGLILDNLKDITPF